MKVKLFYLLSLLLFGGMTGAIADEGALQQARLQLENGQLRSAMQKVEGVLSHEPGNVPARFLQARIHARQGRLERAIADYEALIKDQPTLVEAYNNLAALYVRKGNLEQARLILEQGMETHPAFAALYRNITAVYTEMARRSYTEARLLKEEMKPLELPQLTDLVQPPCEMGLPGRSP